MSPLQIDIIHKAGDWPDVESIIKRALLNTLSYVVSCSRPADITHTAQPEVSIVLADDSFIKNLNKAYRNQNKPTNVLSFPQNDPRHLGDIVFALQTITHESQQQNKSFEDHLIHLSVHGMLHLWRYDHETDEQAAEMEALEIKILQDLGVENPYEAENFEV